MGMGVSAAMHVRATQGHDQWRMFSKRRGLVDLSGLLNHLLASMQSDSKQLMPRERAAGVTKRSSMGSGRNHGPETSPSHHLTARSESVVLLRMKTLVGVRISDKDFTVRDGFHPLALVFCFDCGTRKRRVK